MAAPIPITIQAERGAAARKVAARGSDFADLLRRVKAAGLLQRRPGYYLTKIAVTGGLLAVGWVGFVLLGDSWWQLAVAASARRADDSAYRQGALDPDRRR